jgi:hypothetical protein
MRYLLVSKDVRQHRLISSDYITTLPVTAEVASSSLVVPAILSKRVALIPFFWRSELFSVTHVTPWCVCE